ncbi:MAG: tubulin/FtsZ family protein [Methanomicrobiales archaeon]
MRIFAIGLGGAGCRIADMLYGQDRQFSKVSCVEAIAIDRDAGTLNHLAHIPAGKRIYFPSVSLLTDDITDDITTDEILNLLHNLDTGDKDAIILCTGAGGTMAGIGVAILEKIRSTVVEPIFGLVTLPALEEGKRTSTKAAQDIDRLLPLVEGIILFDNEKLPVHPGTGGKKTRQAAFQRLNPLSKTEPADDRQGLYKNANTGIARRLGLLLRAGEINEGGEIETGEVVLDAGEILNTIRGMGFIAIGYAAADTSGEKFHIGSLFNPSGARVESGHKKAERLVDLAKEAIYENISIPCDLTSAEKALILVAGPSQAISLKGFMTVRKWIDRSIAGMEMRSGDYPVKNTRYIAIIIILAGLTNIPRIKEIRAIRDDYSLENPGWEQEWHRQAYMKGDRETGVPKTSGFHGTIAGTTSASQENIQTSIHTRGPDLGQQKSSAPIPVPDRSPVKRIRFFNRHKTTEKTAVAVPGDPGIPGPDNTVTTIYEPGRPIPDNIGQIKPIPDIPERPSDAATTLTIPGNEEIKQDTPVTIRNAPAVTVEETMKTDLASVVARAREDLKKMDEKQ